MKIGEVKLKLSNAVLNLIDTYFNGKDMSERFINSTLKIILKQNLYRVDSVLSLFADKDGKERRKGLCFECTALLLIHCSNSCGILTGQLLMRISSIQ